MPATQEAWRSPRLGVRLAGAWGPDAGVASRVGGADGGGDLPPRAKAAQQGSDPRSAVGGHTPDLSGHTPDLSG